MILPNYFTEVNPAYPFAVALYLDAYALNDTLVLPKRPCKDVINPKRLTHLDKWNTNLHTAYRKLPGTLNLEQFVILDDGWAAATLNLVQTQFPGKLNAAAKVAFHVWERILFWAQYGTHSYTQGFITTFEQVADICACSAHFSAKVIWAMMDADLIHRKWVGSGFTGHGSCYLAGPKDSLDKLLEKSNIGS